VEYLPLDLASFASVRAFASAFGERGEQLDVLVNNAGGVLRSRSTTEDGHETQLQVNHLSHFLLTNLLREPLERAGGRVVNVSSTGHTFARKGLDFDDLEWANRRYQGFGVYCATKLANILFTRELATRWAGTGVTTNAVHPGFVGSNFGREGDMGILGGVAMLMARPFAISSATGARTSIYLASSPDVEGVSGQYFYKCRVTKPSDAALDDAAAARLWEVSAEMTGVS
jgi:NAD(P)-dependent dehydrogenase (short-subunit alcohol dehydrogenase family)